MSMLPIPSQHANIAQTRIDTTPGASAPPLLNQEGSLYGGAWIGALTRVIRRCFSGFGLRTGLFCPSIAEALEFVRRA